MAVSAPRSIITIVLLEQIESGLDFSEATQELEIHLSAEES